MARTAVIIISAMAMLATSLTLSADVGADDNPATDDFTMSCSVTPDTTPNDIVDAGVQAVVPGEWATFATTVVLDQGTIYQDILQRPDGSTYYASYIELVELPSNLILDPLSVLPTVDGNPLPVLNQSTPAGGTFVLSSIASG